MMQISQKTGFHMNKKQFKSFILLIGFSFILIACGINPNSSSSSSSDSQEGKLKEIDLATSNALTRFWFEKKNNPKLANDVLGTMTNQKISVIFPSKTDVSNLKASFSVDKKAVLKIGNTLQVSGQTINDFTNSVRYKVLTEKGTQQIYDVNVQCFKTQKTSNQGENEMNAKFKTAIVASAIFANACGSNSQVDKNNKKPVPPPTPKPPVVKPATSLDITDPLYKDQWYLKNTGQFGGTAGIDIGIEPVWKQGYTGKGTHIAILDEPLGLTESTAHEDLKANQNFSQSHNYFTYNDTKDNHGVAVAGIIAANANDLGVRGIAYESTLYTYGVLSDIPLTMSNVIDAMEKIYQNSQISVVNNSWGRYFILIDAAYRRSLEKGLQTGFSGKGIVHVKGAGNDGIVLNSTMEGENNYYGFIIVNSLDYDGVNTRKWVSKPGGPSYLGIAFNTSIGANLWVSAPGYKLMTTEPFNLGRRKYNYFKATSSATPVVTGIVALMRQANPNLTWRDVKLILAETTFKNDASHSGWQQGHFKKSKPAESFYFNHHYGFGMVKADQAIALAKTWVNLPTMKTKTFASATLDLTIDANVKENTITVQNSGIDFIESVVVELEVEKKANIESSENFDLKLVKEGIESHIYMEDQSFKFKYGNFTDPHYNQTQMTFKMLTNAHIGGQANGSWKIKIKDTEVFTKLKNWKLIIRGH